jgi:hypothetical protein
MLMSAAGRVAPRPGRAPLSPPPRRTERGGRQARLRIARTHSCVRARVARARVARARVARARVARARVPRPRVAGARARRTRRGRARSAASALKRARSARSRCSVRDAACPRSRRSSSWTCATCRPRSSRSVRTRCGRQTRTLTTAHRYLRRSQDRRQLGLRGRRCFRGRATRQRVVGALDA